MADIAFDIIGRDRASAAFRSVGKSAAGADKNVSGFSSTLKSHVGRFAALTGASLGAGALLGFAKSSITTEAAFSTSMRMIRASSGATASQMDQMNKLAIDLGIKTVYSANEAADAMLELSKAGISTKDIMKGAAQGTLLLASAGGTDLTTAATIAANAMNAFNLKGRDMGKIAAALAGGANASSASVESLGLGLAQVGPGARNAGLSLQETVAALSAFDAAGIKGSDAGTSLKTMLTRLIPMTKKSAVEMDKLGLFSKKTGSAFVNANGTFKNLTQISGLLHDKLGKLSQAQRAQALSIIFGSDATRAASVLMNNGSAGIRKYLKATNDQRAAQKMANAAMGGTRGALEQLNGSIDTAKLKLGQALAPVVIKVSNYLAQKMVPAMDGAISMAKDMGNTLNATVVPPLKIVGSLVVDVAKFFGSLPGPLKSVGIEAGIAALVFPRLAAGVATATTAIKDQITFARVLRLEMVEGVKTQGLMSTAMTKLGGAAKMAAGVGGMVAMTESAKTGNKSLKVLLSTAGAAATGFSVGGPWGAAIGGAAGLLMGLVGATHKSSAAMDAAKQSADQYATSLDGVTGAITDQTRSIAFQDLAQSGAVAAAAKLGISQRTLVSAVLGNKKAIAEVASWTGTWTNATGYLSNEQIALVKAAKTVTSSISTETNSLHDGIAATRAKALATGHLSKVLKGVPHRIAVKIAQEGARPQDLTRDLVRYIRQGKLVPKQLKTIIRATGIDTTAKDLMKLAKTSHTVQGNVQKNSKDTGSAWAQFFGQGVTSGKPKVDASLNGLVIQSSNGVRGKAGSGGHGVGYNLSLGVGIGIAAGGGIVNAAATQIINNALAHMRAAAKTKSPPSRKTMKIGNDLGAGLHLGLRASNKGAKSAGVELIESLVKGIDHHKVRVKDVLGKLTDYISSQTSKISNLMSQRQGIIDSLKGFSSSVFGATFSDAQGNERAGSIADLIAFQQQQRDQAVQVQQDIQSLISKNVSGSLLQQLQSEGAAGLANIHTLAGASAAQIAEINSLNFQTSAAGAASGNEIAGALGINSQISSAKKDQATAEALAREFRKVLHEERKDMHVYVYLDGKEIHTVLLKERAKTKKPLGLG